MNKQKIITVTAGHSNTGKIDSGAVTKDKDGNLIKEADLAVLFRNAVVSYLQKHKDVHVRVDGYGQTNLPLSEAIKLIDGSDVAVEWHMNTSSNASANGVETIALPKDKALAQKLSGAIASVFGSKVRGDKGWIDQSASARGKLGFVQNKGLIVEIGFISNEKELAMFNEKYWLAAKAVSEVILKHVGVI